MKNKQNPIYVKVVSIAATAFLVVAIGGASFVAGYGLAYMKTSDAIEETALLKARAADLETEILTLKNYAVLIDALATNGKASRELQNLPVSQAPPVDTFHDTTYLPIGPVGAEGEK